MNKEVPSSQSPVSSSLFASLPRKLRIHGIVQALRGHNAWQKARELTRDVYAISSHGAFSKDYGLRDQIRRATVSVMANIAEGFDRGGTKEFNQFLSASKGSLGEVKSHLCVALDQLYIRQEDFDRLYGLADEVGKMVNGLMTYLRSTELRGTKYKK